MGAGGAGRGAAKGGDGGVNGILASATFKPRNDIPANLSVRILTNTEKKIGEKCFDNNEMLEVFIFIITCNRPCLILFRPLSITFSKHYVFS